jgi:hypothetical protein
MSNSETVSREFFDKPLDFTYEGRDYIWYGIYKLRNTGLRVDIEILDTDFFAYYRDFSDVLIQILPTNDILSQIEIEIQKIINFK